MATPPALKRSRVAQEEEPLQRSLTMGNRTHVEFVETYVMPDHSTPKKVLAEFIESCKKRSDVYVFTSVDKDGYWVDVSAAKSPHALLLDRRPEQTTVVFNVLEYENNGLPEPFYGLPFVMVIPESHKFIQRLVFTDTAHAEIEAVMMKQENEDMEENTSHMSRMFIRNCIETMDQFVERVVRA